MAAPAPAPAPRIVYDDMIGEFCHDAMVDLMLEENIDITDVRIYPMNRSPSPIPPGEVYLIIYYQPNDENNANTICWPAPTVYYNHGMAPAQPPMPDM